MLDKSRREGSTGNILAIVYSGWKSVDLLIEAKLEITDHNSAGTYGYYPSFIEDRAITHAS